jgi:hypothetical protein
MYALEALFDSLDFTYVGWDVMAFGRQAFGKLQTVQVGAFHY